MRKPPRAPTRQVAARYAILQLPELALVAIAGWVVHHWYDVPVWLLFAAGAAWVAKDVLLFPVVRLAYEPRSGGGAHDLIGIVACAQEALDPHGYVRVGHELWRAERAADVAPIARGDAVRVRRVENLTLVVEPAPEEGDP